MPGRACTGETNVPLGMSDVAPDDDIVPDVVAEDDRLEDPLSAGRGIAIGMVLALPCWALIAFGLYKLLRWFGI